VEEEHFYSTNKRLRSFLLWLILGVVTAVLAAISGIQSKVTADDTHQRPTAPLQISLIDVFPGIVDGFNQPVDIAHAGDNRLFIVEKDGIIRIGYLDGEPTAAPVFLDIRDRVEAGPSEALLLGLSFYPYYDTNGYFYVNYTHDKEGQLVTRISRFRVVDGLPDEADPGSELILLEIEQPFGNHNAGDLNFGPDGTLYFGLGDGGDRDDPEDRAQDLTVLLGKMIRINVDPEAGDPPDCGGSSAPYSVPPTNPFVDGSGQNCDEIWAYGLRNPWRFSFDQLTNDVFIGDVGQGQWEEIDFQPAGSNGGENYGWRCYEGNHAYITNGCSSDAGDYVFPIHEYEHESGRRSVTGGYVYRGNQYPGLHGHYLYADYGTGEIWRLTPGGGDDWTNVLLVSSSDSVGLVSSFGEDAGGELYLAQYAGNGKIYRIQSAFEAHVYLPAIRKP
jgi:glucose/arabinose dehydrogenase